MRRQKLHKSIKLLASSVVLAIGLGGLAYAALSLYGKPTPDAFNCFDVPDQAQRVVLFDSSDPRFNEDQARALRNYFDSAYRDLAFNERLSVYTTEHDVISPVPKARFHVCGAARHASELEAIGAAGADPGYLKKQKQRVYEKILAPELDALLAEEPEETRWQPFQSPILEMIADLARTVPLTAGSRLIVVSDLLQHSDSARFCRVRNHMPRFSAFKKRRVYRKLKPPSLEGVDVEVLMLQRVGYGQGDLAYCSGEDEIRTFWRDYLLDNGVTAPRFIRIRHGYVLG